MEIEIFFEQKEKAIYTLLSEIIKDKKAYSVLFNKYDLEKIYKTTEEIILKILLKRFKNLPVPVIQLERTSNNRIDFFNLIDRNQIKQRKTLSGNEFTKSIGVFVKDFFAAFGWIIISLPKSRSSSFKLEELNRVSRALNAIKRGIIKEINSQVANVFYKTHNLLLNSKLSKYNLLKIENDQTLETKVLEAFVSSEQW